MLLNHSLISRIKVCCFLSFLFSVISITEAKEVNIDAGVHNKEVHKVSENVTTFFVAWNAGAPSQVVGFSDCRALLVIELNNGKKFKARLESFAGNPFNRVSVPGWKWGIARFSAFDINLLQYVGLSGESGIPVEGTTSIPSGIKIAVQRSAGVKLIARFINEHHTVSPGYGSINRFAPNRFLPNSVVRGDYAALPPVTSSNSIQPLSRVMIKMNTGDGARNDSELQFLGESTDGLTFAISKKGFADNSTSLFEQLVGASVQRGYLHRLRMRFLPASLSGAEGVFDTGDEIEVKDILVSAGDEDTGRYEPVFDRMGLNAKLGKDVRWWESPILAKRKIASTTLIDQFKVVVWTGSDDLRISTTKDMPLTVNYGTSVLKLWFYNSKTTSANFKDIIPGYYPNTEPILNFVVPASDEERKLWMEYMTKAFSLYNYRSQKAFSSNSGTEGYHLLAPPISLIEFQLCKLFVGLGRGSGPAANEQSILPGLQADQWDYDGIDIYYKRVGSDIFYTLYSERIRSRYNTTGLPGGSREFRFSVQNDFYMPKINPGNIRLVTEKF